MRKKIWKIVIQLGYPNEMWRYEILNASDKILNVAINAERTFRYEQPKVLKVTLIFHWIGRWLHPKSLDFQKTSNIQPV